MKEDKIDLLLAAQVLDLAATIRKDSWNAYAAEHGCEPNTSNDAMEAWRSEHLIAEFVPQALKTLEEVAEQIRSIKASSQE